MKRKTSFSKIQTCYWYCFLKRDTDKCELKYIKEEIQFLTLKLENKVRKDQKELYEGKLKKARDKLVRLEKNGATAEEFQSFLFNWEKAKDFEKYIVVVDDKSDSEWSPENRVEKLQGYFQSKTWGNYGSGSSRPDNAISGSEPMLKQMLVFDAMSESAFLDGPALIFRIFETVNLRDAVNAFMNSIMYVISISVMDKNLDTESAKTYLTQIIKVNYYDFYGSSSVNKLDQTFEIFNGIDCNYSDEDQRFSEESSIVISKGVKACIRIAYAYINSKFLGNIRKLAYEAFVKDTLISIEQAFSIDRGSWFELEISDNFKILEEFIEAKSFFQIQMN